MEQPAEPAFHVFGQCVAFVVALYQFWHVIEDHDRVADLVVDLQVAGPMQEEVAGWNNCQFMEGVGFSTLLRLLEESSCRQYLKQTH